MPAYQFNQRKQQRLVANLKVHYRLGSRSGNAYTLDLSAGGLFLQTVESFTIGEWLEMNFSVGIGNERRPVACIGQVLRIVVREQAVATGLLPGVGIEFRKFLQGLDDLRLFLASRLGVSMDEVGEPSFGPVPSGDASAPRTEVRDASAFPRRSPAEETVAPRTAAAIGQPAAANPSPAAHAAPQVAAAARPAPVVPPAAAAVPMPEAATPQRTQVPDAEATFVTGQRTASVDVPAPSAERLYPRPADPEPAAPEVFLQPDAIVAGRSDFDTMMAIAGRMTVLVAALVVLSFVLAQLRVTPWDLVPWSLLPWGAPR